MRILVVGTRKADAGKTTFTRGLLAATGAPGFKPRAANDRWYDHDAYQQAIGEERLYGKDARLLARDQAPERSIEGVNPVHRLWRQTPDAAGGMHDVPHRQFLVDRVGEEFVVNKNAQLPSELTRALALQDARRVSSIGEMNAAVQDLHRPVLQQFESGLRAHPAAVVEAYGDIAMPVESVEFDTVAAVEPGRVRYFEGSRYGTVSAAAATSPREGTMEPIVTDVLRKLEPLATAELPPLSATIRETPTEIARAYRAAYEPVFQAGR